MFSVSDVLARYEPDTDSWVGFVPEFVKLMSNDLGFEYDITDERSLCDVIAVEYFRMWLREEVDICATQDGYAAECCAVAKNEYAPHDFGVCAAHMHAEGACEPGCRRAGVRACVRPACFSR
jgi:hypothetical protein